MPARAAALVGAGLLLVGVAAGCAGAAAPTATPTMPPPTPTPQATPTATAAPAPTRELTGVELGRVLSAQNGCTACHSIDGSPKIGPTWKGLFGKEETLAGGSKVTVDEDYLRESILDPNASIVKGFAPDQMPATFGDKLSEEQIQALIEYIKTVK